MPISGWIWRSFSGRGFDFLVSVARPVWAARRRFESVGGSEAIEGRPEFGDKKDLPSRSQINVRAETSQYFTTSRGYPGFTGAFVRLFGTWRFAAISEEKTHMWSYRSWWSWIYFLSVRIYLVLEGSHGFPTFLLSQPSFLVLDFLIWQFFGIC